MNNFFPSHSFSFYLLTVMIVLLVRVPSVGQNHHSHSNSHHPNQHFLKQARKDRKRKYIKSKSRPGKQCFALEMKRNYVPGKPFSIKKKQQPSNPAPDNFIVDAKPLPVQTPKPIAEPSTEEIAVVKHETLNKNDLPKPASEKQHKIRQTVQDEIAKNDDSEPKKLEPLYFTFDEDEFSVVDMDPFLIAVEYALQGKMILIEGHTDSHGNDDYNVQLSIKRVQKIKELMGQMGVPDDRISVVGYGEEIASHSNATAEGRQMNRRVDFTAF